MVDSLITKTVKSPADIIKTHNYNYRRSTVLKGKLWKKKS